MILYRLQQHVSHNKRSFVENTGGAMDNAPVYGAGDARFKSWQARGKILRLIFVHKSIYKRHHYIERYRE